MGCLRNLTKNFYNPNLSGGILKKSYICLISALAFTASVIGTSARAAESATIDRVAIEKMEKDIAKSKEKVNIKVSEIITKQEKLDKDIAQFGATSSQVKEDQAALKSMRTELIELKVDLYKNTAKKKIEEGESIETDVSC